MMLPFLEQQFQQLFHKMTLLVLNIKGTIYYSTHFNFIKVECFLEQSYMTECVPNMSLIRFLRPNASPITLTGKCQSVVDFHLCGKVGSYVNKGGILSPWYNTFACKYLRKIKNKVRKIFPFLVDFPVIFIMKLPMFLFSIYSFSASLEYLMATIPVHIVDNC